MSNLSSILRYLCAVSETRFCEREISKVIIFPNKQRNREEEGLEFEE